MDQPPGEEVYGLFAVLPVANVAALDANHLEHRLEDGRLDLSTCWKSDDDNCTAGANVFSCLLEGLLGDCNQDDSMWAEAVLGGGTDVLGDV